MDKNVTVVVTSYNRPDLLEVTLKSFNQFVNQEHFAEKFVIDDFSDLEPGREIRRICKEQGFKCISVPYKFGQFRCIDAAYHLVTTPYIFHCEDDWNFVPKEYEVNKQFDITKIDMVAAMKSVLEHDENAVVVMGRRDCPFGSISPQRHQTYNGIEYYIHNLWWNGQWGGYTFNPGLVRKSDYDTYIKSFYDNFTDESKVSPHYLNLGKYVTNLVEKYQSYYHIGGGRSMDPHLSNKKEI